MQRKLLRLPEYLVSTKESYLKTIDLLCKVIKVPRTPTSKFYKFEDVEKKLTKLKQLTPIVGTQTPVPPPISKSMPPKRRMIAQ